MGELELPGDIRIALSHTAAYGIAAILEDQGRVGVGISWTTTLDGRAVVSTPGCDIDEIAGIVLAHARRHTAGDDWTAATINIDGSEAGRLSPRIKCPVNDAAWRDLVRSRRETIDREANARRWLDLAMIGALGEPAYWRFDHQGKPRPDQGASQWEMKTRNSGEDFVRHRLRKLALSVAARDLAGVRDGLTGAGVVDEAGRNEADSRTGTGLVGLGPVDNALAWCALWGLSRFVVVAMARRPSESAGHGSARRPGALRESWFHLPIPSLPMTLSRLGTIIVSDQLDAVAAADALPDGSGALSAASAREWLMNRGIGAVARFPIGWFGSASAPERRALLGSIIRLAP
jgi:CRISPR-associated protein Csb3